MKPRKAPLHRLGEVPRALRALALQIEHGDDRAGREPGDWRKAYAGDQGRAELISKALRHLVDLAAGELLDEHGRPNGVAALADLAYLVELEGHAAGK